MSEEFVERDHRFGPVVEVEAHSRKPDSTEPWRYVCPNCRTQIQGSGWRKNQIYECRDCADVYTFDELWDRKNGKPVHEVKHWRSDP